jgi:Domain of unknown function (DUF4258)
LRIGSNLADALREHGRTHEVTSQQKTGFGPRYVVEGELNTPTSCRPRVRTVWHLGLVYLISELSSHARRAVAEREIPVEWIERTLEAPELIVPDPNDATIERCFRRIPEFGGRVLRVAVNKDS